MIYSVKREDLIILSNRQRQEHDPAYITNLATSIDVNGLLHPIVIRTSLRLDNLDGSKPALVAGECRIKAIEQLWIMGKSIRCGGKVFPEGNLPCTSLGDLSDVDAYEAELEENIRRKDLTWQEATASASQLFELRNLQAHKRGTPAPTFESIAQETGAAIDVARQRVLVARHLKDPDVARATSVKEAFKVVKRKEELQRSKDLGEKVGATFSARDHSLRMGDCTKLLQELPDESFDVILTDPPYGMNAQDFGDAGGKAQGEHFYDDSFNNWLLLMSTFCKESFRIAKSQAHAYVFCDIDNFSELRTNMSMNGWKVFRTPIIWHNPTSQRAPWPTMGPQRKYQLILYAVKGDRNVLAVKPDLVTYPSDDNLNHQAQKPVALYSDLLRRSVHPGDSALDPFCGTGPIFPAAHELKVKATGIELAPSAYGIAVERIARLK